MPGPVAHRRLATDALDALRRGCGTTPGGAGQKAVAKDLKGARYALWKNPTDLTERQQVKLSDIRRTNEQLYRAYLMKEQLWMVLHQPTYAQALDTLAEWLAWACRSRIPAFVKLSRKIRRHRTGIQAALVNELSSARVESGEHQDPADHPPRLRVPLPRSAHRAGHALPRRVLPTPARPSLTTVQTNPNTPTVDQTETSDLPPARPPLKTSVGPVRAAGHAK